MSTVQFLTFSKLTKDRIYCYFVINVLKSWIIKGKVLM